MGLRNKLRRLQRIADKDLITFELKDGTAARFPADAVFPEAFIYETERWKAAYRDPGLLAMLGSGYSGSPYLPQK